MLGTNQVLIIGRLGKDPEGRSFANGGMMVTMIVATTYGWVDKSKNKQENTEWHRIIAYHGLADFCMVNFNKGKLICVEGVLRHRQYENQQGFKHYITEIEAMSVQTLD